MDPRSTSIPDAPAAAEPVATPEGCLKRWAKHLGPAGPLAAVMIVLPVVGGLLLLGFIRQLAPWLKHHASAGTVLLAALCIAMLAGASPGAAYLLGNRA